MADEPAPIFMDASDLEYPPYLIWTREGNLVTIQAFTVSLRAGFDGGGITHSCSVMMTGNWLCGGELGRRNRLHIDEDLHFDPYDLPLSATTPLRIPATTFPILVNKEDLERCAYGSESELDVPSRRKHLFTAVKGQDKEVAVVINSPTGLDASMLIPMMHASMARASARGDRDVMIESLSSDTESEGTEYVPEGGDGPKRRPKPLDLSKVGMLKPPSVPTAIKGQHRASPPYIVEEREPVSKPPSPPSMSLPPTRVVIRVAGERVQEVQTSPSPPRSLVPPVSPPQPLVQPPEPHVQPSSVTCSECRHCPPTLSTSLCLVCTNAVSIRRLEELRATLHSLVERKRRLAEQCVALSSQMDERLSKRSRYYQDGVRDGTARVAELEAQVTFLEAEVDGIGKE